jgi:hypothetical protein
MVLVVLEYESQHLPERPKSPSFVGKYTTHGADKGHDNPHFQIFQGSIRAASTSQVLFCFFVNGFLAITAYACAMGPR